MRSPLERTDWALLAAYLLGAALGTLNSCLLVHDGAVFLAAGWLGDAWDLYLDQNTPRAVSNLLAFGPAWAARWAFAPSSRTYIVLAHALYFAAPLLPWLVLRAIEPQRLFSRLYLAITLPLIYFLLEVVIGFGLWMIWIALASDPARSQRQASVATLLLGALMAFTHPVTGLMSLFYLLVGGALVALGRPFPRRTLALAAGLTVLLIAAYFAAAKWLPATNPTVLVSVARIRYDYIDPRWMLATLAVFPMLAALWLLLLAPGADAGGLRYRLSPRAVLVVAALGLWFAAAGTGLLTWLYARHTAGYILALATALALVRPSEWAAQAHRPLRLYAAIAAVSFVSYNVDLFLYGRFVDRYLAPGVVDVDDNPQPAPWPPRFTKVDYPRVYFKWLAEPDYTRGLVVPSVGRYRLALAIYSFFRSDRRSVLFHRLPEGEWIPFECGPIDRALAQAHDALDRQFLTFLSGPYCVR
jgi:hypothetical protein